MEVARLEAKALLGTFVCSIQYAMVEQSPASSGVWWGVGGMEWMGLADGRTASAAQGSTHVRDGILNRSPAFPQRLDKNHLRQTVASSANVWCKDDRRVATALWCRFGSPPLLTRFTAGIWEFAGVGHAREGRRMVAWKSQHSGCHAELEDGTDLHTTGH